MKKIYSILLLLLVYCSTMAQTILTTGNPNPITNFSGSANFLLTFIITNNNNYPIDITNMDVYRGTVSNGTTYSLYYHTTSLSGSTSFTAPGWNFVTSTSPVSSVTGNGIHPTFSNFTLTMPANTTWRFMQVCSGSQIVCGGTTASPNSFTGGGVTIGVGNYQINGSNVGYAASGASTPYSWGGTITFSPSVPCTNPPTAGTATVSNANPCPGMAINFNISNGTGGLGQTYQWQSAPSATGPWTNITGATSAYYPTTAPATTTHYRMFVTCGSGSDTTQPISVTIPSLFPGGTYTIDNTPSAPTTNNFTTFAAAAAAINCGISGPVVFNVTPGTYNNDHFRLDNYLNGPGKTVTINGNGAVLQNLGTGLADAAIVRLNGTMRVTIDSLKIEGISNSTSQAAWGIFLTNNADSNTIINCTITLDTTATSTNYAGIVVSGGATSATLAGSGCDGLVISNNVIKGGYYGLTLMGNTSTNILQSNTVTNNIFRDFYIYGIYASYSNNMTIANNDISRPTRTSVTTFGGIYLTTGHTGLNVSKNRIHDPAVGNPNASFTHYGIYISGAGNASNPNIFSNNLIYNLQGGGTGAIYGFYNTGGTHSKYYFNTVANNFTASTGSGAAYAFYQTGTATGIQLNNNNFYVTRGGTGANWGIYVNTAAQTITSNYNNVYVNGASGSNNFGYYGGNPHISLSAWNTASSQDANSYALDPVFLNPTSIFIPTNGQLDDKGTPITNITTDINNASRNATTPDIGAYEFSVPPCSSTPSPGIASAPSSACPGASFTLQLTGYTVGTGIIIQWQSSPAGTSTFTNIPGATTPSYTISQTAAMEYKAKVTCTNGGGNDETGVVTVTLDPFYLCYCSPLTGVQLHTTVQNYITNVTIQNTTLNNTTSVAGPGGYTRTNYLVGNNTATLSQTTQYTITANVPSTSYNVMAWIDYDQSGTMDSIEAIQLITTGNIASATFSIPTTALTGLTGLRLRVYTSTPYGPTGACSTVSVGYETEDYVITVAGPPACIQPSGFAISNITSSGAEINWTPVTGASGYEWAISTSSTQPTAGTPISTDTVWLSGLNPSTYYYFFVRSDCGTNGHSLWSVYTFTTAAVNNDPWNAIPITVGATCTGSPFTTLGGSHATNEPWPTCAGTGGYHSVWYSFVAPPSGAVKISTDFAGGTMSTDSRLALFSTTNVNNYANYTILACDDDNGSTVSIRSIIYATGLANGTTYYILVDVFDAVSQASTSFPGTFCMEVHELNSTMLAASGSCSAGQGFNRNAGYKGMSALADASGNLIAIVKDTAGNEASYASNITKNTSAVRQAGGQYYLDRNFLINAESKTTPILTGNFEVQLFFLSTELNALQGVYPSATLSNLNVTRQTGTTCQANFNQTAGTISLLSQIGNGTINNAHWVTVNTPGFSNFYIQSGTTPLVIRLLDIAATNVGAKNKLYWQTEAEVKGDQFEVERSANGTDFNYLTTIRANGEASTYTYWDEQPLAGINYYRLKMMDAAGNIAYSKTVTAHVRNGSFRVEAYPNPVKDLVTVKLIGTVSANASLLITDLSGKVMKELSVTGSEIKCDMSGWAQGIYLIKYTDNDQSHVIKINRK